MKKLLFIFCVISKIGLSQMIELGPSLFSGISSSRTPTLSFDQAGFCTGGGLTVQLKLTPYLFIGCDVLYDRKGFRHHYSLTDPQGNPTGTAYIKSHRNYISVPIYVNLRFGGNTKFIVNAGGYYNYLLLETLQIPSYLYANNNSSKNTKIENDNKFDAGVLLGLGLTTPLSSKVNFNLELRNCIGLVNVSQVPLNNILYLNSHYLFLGLNFKLGNKE